MENQEESETENNGWVSSWDKCKQMLSLKVEQYGKHNRNWRRCPLKDKLSSTLHDTVLLTACLGRNHDIDKETHELFV